MQEKPFTILNLQAIKECLQERILSSGINLSLRNIKYLLNVRNLKIVNIKRDCPAKGDSGRQ